MTSTSIAADHLEANLAALGGVNADVVEQLRQTKPRLDVDFFETAQGLAGKVAGRSLCSRRPRDEAVRLTEDVDLVDNALIVCQGFGMGWHVQHLAERLGKAGIIIVFEPDLALARAVLEHVDHSRWLRATNVIWVSDAEDRGRLADGLRHQEPIIMQGVAFVDAPGGRARLGDDLARFTRTLTDYITAAKTALLTTLTRSVETTQNYLRNIDQYALGAGISDLKGAAAGFPGLVISAGPGLARNIHVLADTGARERCVLVAVQTALKPLLEAGVKPHFITALDYHEISARFYDGLDADAVRGITLLADPKVHANVIRAWPGVTRCCESGFLNRLLGAHARPMGALDSGATVAHLAMFLARYLGCTPIGLMGQDLGFPDGLYYAPGTAIHREWAPELNPFNTIAMMEWQRIVRMRHHLHKAVDINDRSIYTDTQMLTYLQQFEGYFAQYAREGISIIDCTESGVRKQHCETMPLRQMIEHYATDALPDLPQPSAELDRQPAAAVIKRIESIRRDGRTVRETSRRTLKLLEQMLRDQRDAAAMDRHFKRLDQLRKKVDARSEAFVIINQLNQLGMYRRLRADRRLHMQEPHIDELQRQRLELERDHDNVSWLIEAASEMDRLLLEATRTLRGEVVAMRRYGAARMTGAASGRNTARVAALIPIESGGADGDVLSVVLRRLCESAALDQITILCAKDDEADLTKLVRTINASTGSGRLDISIEAVDGSPFGPEHAAILKTRLWSRSSWRGGVAGTTIYDEVLCPQVMSDILDRGQFDAALVVGPDWPAVNITGPGGCDDLIARHREYPERYGVVFSQAAPGFNGIVISANTMRQLVDRNRAATIGGLLGYHPHLPQPDPIGNACCVQVPAPIRHTFRRATSDTPRGRLNIAALSNDEAPPAAPMPAHLQVELCTDWPDDACGVFHRTPAGHVKRRAIDSAIAMRLFNEACADNDEPVALSLVGFGDPLLHPQVFEIINAAHEAGIAGIHLRTTLNVDDDVIAQLLRAPVDVLSVELHADSPQTYELMMGSGFERVIDNIGRIVKDRRRFTPHTGGGAIALPWIVPRFQKCAENYEEMERFYERWSRVLGTAVIEAPPMFDPHADWTPDALAPAVTPVDVMWNQLMQRMTVYSDGGVPVSEMDIRGSETAGNIADTPVRELWRALVNRRRALRDTHGPDVEALRTVRP